jgi:Protein of unknown function (DUF3309)
MRPTNSYNKQEVFFMGTILIILLILLLVGALPTWPYSSGWGYYPSGGLGLVLVVIIVLLLFGRL